MALLQILLLLLYALPSFLLPITSNPLGLEDTPDNLAWAAQSLEGRSEHEGVRKIPKSIFITPEHADKHPMGCPNGFYLRSDGKCCNKNDFVVNPLQHLTSQLEQFLVNDKVPTTIDYDEYDYDSYDSTESNGPYHIPLSLSFDDQLPSSDKTNDAIQNMPFLADNQEETLQKHPSPDSGELDTTKLNVVPPTATVFSNVDEWNNDILAGSKDGTGSVEEVKSTTLNDMVATSSDESLVIFSDGMSTTHKKNLVDMDNEENLPSTESTLNLTTAVDEIEPNDGESTTLTNQQRIKLNIQQTSQHGNHHSDGNYIESTTQTDDKKTLDKELQSESLFEDDSLIRTTINVSDGTTEISENDLYVTTETLNSVNDGEVNKAISISTPITPVKRSNHTKNPIVVVPTVEQVQIVTPVQLTTTSQRTTSTHHRKKSTNQSIPSSTSKYDSELQTAERLDVNDSLLNKKLRESVMKHELNEDAIETIDTNNRFVYTHLDTSSNEPEPSTSTTMQPITQQPTTQRSLLDQLRFIHKFTDESRKNNRVRFPEPAAVNIFSNFKGGTIKFPGPVQQRTSEPLFNRLIPDLIPKKPPEPTRTERPLFSWLPPGTKFDFSRNSSPAFIGFWNKMPLIRDSSMTSGDSPEQPRSNSKSPTDNLYKDAPASEVYKVISSKNYKHDNR